MIMAMPRCLFVYGTLMSTARGALGLGPRGRLDLAGRVVGAASMSGQLYDLGAYPGLVEAALPRAQRGDPGRVSGEIRELDDPEAVFRWLDRYEGIQAGNSLNGDYQRVVREAILDEGSEARQVLPAWVYVYRGSLAGARLVGSGRWRS